MTDQRKIVWVTAYPKSGSTWLRLFFAHLLAPASARQESLMAAAYRVPLDFGFAGFDRALGIKMADLSVRDSLNLKPRRLEAEAVRMTGSAAIMRTHDAWTVTPQGEPLLPLAVTRAAIHLVRDPRDIAVSWSEYFGHSLDQTIEIMETPDYAMTFAPQSVAGPRIPLTLLDWSSHCRSWMTPHGFPCLLVRYEDLRADPIGQFARIAGMAGHSASAEELAGAVDATRFETLKARDSQESFSFRGDGRTFFRSGRAGGWKDVLSSAQKRRIEKAHGDMMTGLGYQI